MWIESNVCIFQRQVEEGIPLHICLSRFSRWLQTLQLQKGLTLPGERSSSTSSAFQKPCAFVTWSGNSLFHTPVDMHDKAYHCLLKKNLGFWVCFPTGYVSAVFVVGYLCLELVYLKKANYWCVLCTQWELPKLNWNKHQCKIFLGCVCIRLGPCRVPAVWV